MLVGITGEQLHADSAATGGQDLTHLAVAAHFAAIVFDTAHQRLGELAAAAYRLRDTVAVHQAWHQEQAKASAELVGQL